MSSSQSDEKSLLDAALDGDLKVVKRCVRAGVDVNCRDENQSTPVKLSASNGQTDICVYLTQQGADLNIRNVNGYTPFTSACYRGHTPVVKYLLSQGCDVQSDNDGFTSLHLTSEKGHLEIVKLLITYNANVNAKNKEGSMPLHMAAKNGHLQVCKYLQLQGADLKARSLKGNNPFSLACFSGHIQILKWLISLGCQVTDADIKGYTHLHEASQNGQLEVVKLLIDRGAEVNSKNKEGSTPLDLACQNGHLEVAKLLTDSGADVNCKGEDGATPLFLAAQFGHLPVCVHLLQQGANLKVKSVTGATPLTAASWNGQTQVVKWLLSHGCHINEATNSGLTPLHCASKEGYLELVKLLTDQGADVKAKTKEGKTPMQLAEEKNHTAIVQYLKAYKKTLQTLTVEQSGTVPNQDVTSHYNLSPEGNDNGGAKFSAEKDKSQTAPDDAVKSDQAETFDTLSSEVAKMNIDGSNHSQTGPQIDDKVIKEKDIKKNWTLEQKQNLVKTCVSRFFLGGKYCYGKTSLARSLLHNKGITTEEDERTEVLEFNPWRIDENTTVTMYDLGGHQCYQNLSHIFHCDEKNNFTLLPHQINDKDYSTTCNWINDVISRSPISVIHFILTKSDLLPKDKHNQAKEDFKNHVIQFLKNQMKQIESKLKEKDHKQDKILKKDTNEKLKKLKKIREKYKSLVEDLTHEKILDVVSCKTGEGLSEFRGKIVKIVKTQEFKIDIPKTAHLLYQRLGKLGIEGVKERKALLSVKTLISEVKQNESDEKQGSGESRDAIPKKKEPSSSDTKDEIPTEENKLTSEKEPRKEEYLQYVSFEDAKLELKNLLPASKSDGEITNDLVDYLSLLNCHGLLLWYNTDGLKELIFNDLYSLIQMLKTLFQHSFQENYKTETSEKPESSFDFKKLSEEQQVFLRKERITKTKYNNLLNHLKNQGVLSNLLLKILVKKFHFEDHLGELIHMLDHLGIAYSIPSEKDESDIANRDIFFPWYISQSVAPEDILIKMKEDSKYNFLLKVTVAGTFPSAFFNCLAVRIYKLLVPNDLRQTLEIWQDHIFAWVNKNRVYLEYIKSPNDDKIDIHIVCPFSITSIQESWDFIDNCLKVIDCLNDEWWDGVLNDMYLQCACRHCDRTLVPGRWDILQHLKEKCSESVYQCPNNRTENLPIAFLFPLPQDKYEAQNFVSEAEQYLKNHGHPYTLDESLKKHQADQQYGEREGSSGDEVDKTRKVSKAVEEMKSQNLLSDSRGKGLFAHNAHLKLSKSDFENVLYLMQYVCAVEYSTSEGTGNGTGILLGFVEPKDPGSTVQLSSLINPSVTTNILYAQSNITSQKGAQSGSSTALFHLPTALPVITTKVAVILTSGHILTKWNPNVQQGKLTFDWYKMYGGKVMESNCSGVIAVGDELLDYALLFTSDKNVISRFQNLVQSRPKKLATSSTPPSPNSKMILLGHPKHSFMQGDFIEILDKKSKKDCEKGTNVEWVDRDCSVIYNCCSFHGTSGAPCFKLNDDNNVELVCIHTGGIYLNQSDPKEHDKSDFEFGILVSPILDDINKKLPTLGLKWAIID